MKKYILLYNGPATDMSAMSQEQMQGVMQKWKEWMEELGEDLTDIGAPMANGQTVVDDNSKGSASELSGYSIIQAEDIEGAKKLVANHPFLSDNDGKYKVEVHELQPLPMG
jgi:hypothetical protein